MNTFIITFIALSIINVIFSTVRSITTIKSGTVIASLVSGGYFAFYNIMLVYTVSDFPMWQKCLITFCCNVLGVAIVKIVEQKMQKDKLWKVEATVHSIYQESVKVLLKNAKISFNYVDTWNNCTIFNLYCRTKKESTAVKEILKTYGAKYFVSESKIL